MNNPFQKQPQPADNLPRTPEPPSPQPQPTAPTAPTAPNVTQTPVGSPAPGSPVPGSPVSSGSGKTFRPPNQTLPSLSQGGGSQGGPIYSAEAVDVQRLNNLIYPRNPLEDVRTLFSKQVVVEKNTTVQVNTIAVPGYIGISNDFWVEDPKGNRVSGCADVTAILKTEDLLICTYQENPNTYGIPIDLSAENDQFEEISGLVNQDISGSFKGTLDGLLSNIASNKSLGDFSGHIDLSSVDERAGTFGTKLKGTYEGTLQCRFDGTLQGQLKSTVAFEDELIKGTVIKNGGYHSCAIVPAIKPYYDETSETAEIETFACFEKSRGSTSGGYIGDSSIAIAQRLVFDEVITPAEATGYRHTMINWMGLLSHVVKFADRDINGGDPTTVVDKATLKTILQNCVRASLGDPEALTFFDNSDNKLYCAEFVYIALNTPLFPFHQAGLTALLDGDSNAAKAILGNRERYSDDQFNIFSLVREPDGTNSELEARNILLPSVSETLLPLDQLLTERGRIVQGLPFPPFTIAQVIRRAFRTLLPQPGTLEASKIAKLQVRLFQAIEPMLTQQVVPAVDLSSLTEEAAAAVQADPRVQQIKAFVAQVEETLTTTTDINELDKRFDEIVEQANTLVRQAGSIVEFVPPRIYVDLGQQDGDSNLPQGWGFKLQTIGATIARQSINGAVPPAGIIPPAPTPPAPVPFPSPPAPAPLG